jgi:hypothetical protein
MNSAARISPLRHDIMAIISRTLKLGDTAPRPTHSRAIFATRARAARGASE